MNNLNKKSGFSLIELMVAIAIIGTIATIAIPTYNTFKRRATQVEAKTTLSNIFASQITFITEWGYGTPNLRQMGYDQKGLAHYRAGWHTRDQRPVGVNVNSTTRPVGYNGPLPTCIGNDSNCSRYTNNYMLGTTFAPGAYDPIGTGSMRLPFQGTCTLRQGQTGTCTPIGNPNGGQVCNHSSGQLGKCQFVGGGVNNTNIDSVTFTIGAVSNIGGTQYDRWTMDHNKNLVNTQDGTQ